MKKCIGVTRDSGCAGFQNVTAVMRVSLARKTWSAARPKGIARTLLPRDVSIPIESTEHGAPDSSSGLGGRWVTETARLVNVSAARLQQQPDASAFFSV